MRVAICKRRYRIARSEPPQRMASRREKTQFSVNQRVRDSARHKEMCN